MQTGEGIDRATYDATKDYLKAALEQMIVAGHSVEDLAEFAADKFGGSFYPYLREFQQDVRAGRIKVQGLAESSRASVFGAHVDPQEREHMIREAAYLLAERRGFVGGSPEQDWLAAEAEVDETLARKAGLFERGKKDLDSAKVTANKEAGSIQTVVWKWIEGKGRAAGVPGDGREPQTDGSAARTSTAADRNSSAPGKADATAATKKPTGRAKPRLRKRASAAPTSKPAPVAKESVATDVSAAKPSAAAGRKPPASDKSKVLQKAKKPAAAAKPATGEGTAATASRRPVSATKASPAPEEKARPGKQPTASLGVKKADEAKTAAARRPAEGAEAKTPPARSTATGKPKAGAGKRRGTSKT